MEAVGGSGVGGAADDDAEWGLNEAARRSAVGPTRGSSVPEAMGATAPAAVSRAPAAACAEGGEGGGEEAGGMSAKAQGKRRAGGS